MRFSQLMNTTAIATACLLFIAPQAMAQVEITDARTTGVNTSTAGENGTPSDVTVTSTGTITITTGAGLTVDSDNSATVAGTISSEDADDTTGILIEGGNSGDVTLTGRINLNETFEATDTDDDRIVDGAFAQGSGRTGILISGASPFTGNVTTGTGSGIFVEGNDSFGIRLAPMSMLDGNLLAAGTIDVIGDNARGIAVGGDVTGNVAIDGAITTRGEGASAVVIDGDVGGQLAFAGTINNSGYRFPTRNSGFTRNDDGQVVPIRTLFDAEDTLQAGSAFVVSGNVAGGIVFGETDDVVGTASINQAGAAAAILIDGNGTPILIGLATEITDPNDENFDPSLQFSFVQEGIISANGTLDDISATGLEIADATLSGGINQSGTINSQTFRTGVPFEGEGTNIDGDVAHSYGVRLNAGADVSTFNNSGSITSRASEASDLVFLESDEGRVQDPNDVNATAMLIAPGANLPSLTNTGQINALLSGRRGAAYAIVDQSGTLAVIDNQGVIRAGGSTSDPNASSRDSAPEFTLVALDLSANTSGITLTQSQGTTNVNGAEIAITPIIAGDVILGSGDDAVDVSAGLIVGEWETGAGMDSVSITGSSTAFIGTLNDSDGMLALTVADGASFTNSDAVQINVTDASFAADTAFNPYINARSLSVSSINASGTITFEDGATITPTLSNLIDGSATFTIAEAGTLVVGDSVNGFSPENAPFLYNTLISVDPNNPNRLIASFDLRSTEELGLDGTQTTAFAPIFEVLIGNDSLGAAFAGLTDQESFLAGYNQLLPEFTAAAGRFVQSNVDGATGSVANQLSNARYSNEKPGGAWIQEFAYFADKELVGLSDGYRGYGFGFAGGLDTAFGPFHTAGLAVSFSATEVEDVIGIDDPLSVNTFQTGLYGGYKSGNFFVDSYIGGGYSFFENRRNIEIGSFFEQAEGEWNALHYNASVTAGYDAPLGDKYYLRPSLNINYLGLSEQAYVESGTSAARLRIDDRDSTFGTATALLDFGARFGDEKVWYRPSVRVGYRTEFANDPITTTAFFANTGTPFSLVSQEFPENGLVLGVTFMAGSAYSSFGFDYDADLRDGYNRHTARIILRMLF